MNYLNLDSMIPINTTYKYISYNKFVFPGGEQHIKLTLPSNEPVLINARIKNSADIMTLLLATDALRRANVKQISLYMPYVPFARQDRVMNPGEPLSIKVFADLINSQNYNQVVILDPHSDVTPALLNNCKVITNFTFVSDNLYYYHTRTGEPVNPSVLVAPDAGAQKKIYKISDSFKLPVVTAIKHRNVETGKITGTSVQQVVSLRDKHLFVIDDICDGGATFEMLAHELRRFEPSSINLMVTHGIFSKGFDFAENIDKIFTTNSFQTFINTPEKIKVYNIW